jgi:uncharacterized protein (TIGR02118 family)
MHKLVILVEPLADESAFEQLWPQFLHVCERMPGLQREATSRVAAVLYGKYNCSLLHELFFDSLESMQQAMSSPEGQAAGQLLQRITGGAMTLLFTDHNEDDLENIRKYSIKKEDGNGKDARTG